MVIKRQMLWYDKIINDLWHFENRLINTRSAAEGVDLFLRIEIIIIFSI